ncbi:hypothetical protein ABK040_012078, partial [Willaertia magna]
MQQQESRTTSDLSLDEILNDYDYQWILDRSILQGLKYETEFMSPILEDEEIIKSYNKNIKEINYCNLEGDLYLFATKNEHILRNKNGVTFMEEFLLDKTIQFLLFDYKSYTIKEIKPVIYPITMNLSKEDENDGFQLVALRNL